MLHYSVDRTIRLILEFLPTLNSLVFTYICHFSIRPILCCFLLEVCLVFIYTETIYQGLKFPYQDGLKFMPKCLIMSTVSKYSLIAWKVYLYFFLRVLLTAQRHYGDVVNLNTIEKFKVALNLIHRFCFLNLARNCIFQAYCNTLTKAGCCRAHFWLINT